jgi:hypothetical protein
MSQRSPRGRQRLRFFRLAPRKLFALEAFALEAVAAKKNKPPALYGFPKKWFPKKRLPERAAFKARALKDAPLVWQMHEDSS